MLKQEPAPAPLGGRRSQSVNGDRNIANALAGGMKQGVADRCWRTHDADLAKSLTPSDLIFSSRPRRKWPRCPRYRACWDMMVREIVVHDLAEPTTER
jgi:hypothetical protein